MTIIVGPKANWEWINIDLNWIESWHWKRHWKLRIIRDIDVDIALNWIESFNRNIDIGIELRVWNGIELEFEIELNWKLRLSWIESWDWVELKVEIELNWKLKLSWIESEDWVELKVEIGNATCMYGITRLLNVWAHKMHDYACMNAWNVWLVCSLPEKFHRDRQIIGRLGT
jgi:hypothetical protein